MNCKNCGVPLAEGSETCANCDATLILAKSPFRPTATIPQTPEAASAVHFRSVHEQIWQTLADYQLKQQGELAQLRAELETKLKSIEVPKPKLATGVKWYHKLLNNPDTLAILLLAAVGLAGFIWFISELVNYKQEIRFDEIAVLATTLTVIGSFYLAYELLGRQHGPLRWISIFITSGLIGGVFLEPVTLTAMLMGHMLGALQILLVGVLLGAFSGVLFAIPEDPRHPHIFSGRGAMVGGLMGILFWCSFLFLFVTVQSPDDALLYLLLATLLGVPMGIMIGGFHHFMRGNYRPGRPPIFSWRSSLKAFALILAIWGLILLLTHSSSLIKETLIVSSVALSAAIPSGFSSYVFWWLNHLPGRVLGVVGFVLTLLGAVLPVLQPIFNILNH